MDTIIIRGAREHNLKNINLDLPRNKFIVLAGLSGSGKSSLAFDTIYAEGRRRYMESLSSYARQFLGKLEKPDVDYIEGLSPAIAIEQKSVSHNPRSTVGTVTEIHDYLRLVYARIGVPHCPVCGKEIREQSIDQMIDTVLSYPIGTKIMVLSPVLEGKKGEHHRILEDARKSGFARVRIDGVLHSLEDPISLDKNKRHTIEIVVDRILLEQGSRKRVAESLETALSLGDGKALVVRMEQDPPTEQFFSQKSACPTCGVSLPEIHPRLFSFNSPFGACPACNGLGIALEFDPELIMPNKELSFNEGGIVPFNPEANWYRSKFESLAKHFRFSLDTPLKDLPPRILDLILKGTDEAVEVSYVNREGTGKFQYTSSFNGILAELKRRYLETSSEQVKEWLEQFMTHRPCPSCGGKRLRAESLAVTVGGKNIHELGNLTIKECIGFFESLSLTETERAIASQAIKEISNRLKFLEEVGLGYLTLNREASTLSGGEGQRIRLATQIGSSLVGVLYILDEPTIGLHPRDTQRLVDTLIRLRDQGNTVLVVEHDVVTLKASDWIVELGPGAGTRGGQIVAQGPWKELLSNPESLTGQYLSGNRRIPKREEKRGGKGQYLRLRGGRKNNLKNVDLEVPLGKFVVITGVSGSGKSSLITDLLYPVVRDTLQGIPPKEKDFDAIEGVEQIDKVILVNQSPIGRTPRSNPATYVGLYSLVRELFAGLPESRARGYGPGRFSFNVPGGRCEHCKGDGTIRIEMHFLPDVFVTCEVCKGKRFNRETLDIRYKGKSIHEVLEMTVEEALDFFSSHPRIVDKLQLLHSVGLGYIQLGQSALTFSGGEAQRIKLSLELSRRGTGSTLYILDEPTTGLHFEDVSMLLEVLNRLVDRGNTVILIEHHLEVIQQADWIIDLGPEGGDGGGFIVAQGTPEEVALKFDSPTAQVLRTAMQTRE